MFILRNAALKDVDDLFELSGKVHFINLPHNKKVITELVQRSQQCFEKPGKDLSKNVYMFALEDLSKKKVIGASLIHAQHGTENEPHFFLRISHENKYSHTINTGFVHGTLRLGLDTNGPTEIGGLVVHPDYRGHKEKLGKQISFVRFLYIATHLKEFKDQIHSELMPPFDAKGRSPLWEAIGRRFMNMEYDEADQLSRNNKEFILSLFPADNIYMTLLPIEARNSVGKVGKDTEPVKKMLETIGFQYTNEVDPFDGGPHFRAKTKDVKVIKESFSAPLHSTSKIDSDKTQDVLLRVPSNKYFFEAVKCKAIITEDKIKIDKKLFEQLEVEEKVKVDIIPFL